MIHLLHIIIIIIIIYSSTISGLWFTNTSRKRNRFDPNGNKRHQRARDRKRFLRAQHQHKTDVRLAPPHSSMPSISQMKYSVGSNFSLFQSVNALPQYYIPPDQIRKTERQLRQQ